MLVTLDHFFTNWLGNATLLGASSWLQVFTWIATLIAALIASIALRRNSLQNRATLLLNLYKTWDDLGDKRHSFASFFETTRLNIVKDHAGLQEEHQIEHMRNAFQKQLDDLRKGQDPKFSQFTAYVSFFEVLGMYVKNGYVPLRDVMQVYKGPVLAVDIVWRNYIKGWKKEHTFHPGYWKTLFF